MTQKTTALITGASGGIGEEIARKLAARGINLILVARSQDRLQILADELAKKHKIDAYAVPTDLTKANAAAELQKEIESRSLSVDLLINNAGFADYGEFHTLELQKQLDIIQVNITALTELTHRFLPAMVRRGRGRILNIASTAAFMPGPLMSVYYATKAYVLSLGEGLQEELKGTGVYVTTACPGPVATGFQQAAKMEQSRLLSNAAKIMTAEEVAISAIDAMLRGQTLRVIGKSNQLQALAPRFVPRSLMPRLVKQAQDKMH